MAKKVADAHQEQLELEFPWLQHLDDKLGFVGDLDRTGAQGSGDRLRTEEPLAIDDDLVFEAIKELEVAKALLASAPEASHADFGTKIRGGESQLRKSGEMVDAAQAMARNELALAFCRRRGVNSTFRCGFTRHQASTGVLVRGWARKMQHYFNLELCSPQGADLVFDRSHHADYEESTEFKLLVATADRSFDIDRIEQIRALFK